MILCLKMIAVYVSACLVPTPLALCVWGGGAWREACCCMRVSLCACHICACLYRCMHMKLRRHVCIHAHMHYGAHVCMCYAGMRTHARAHTPRPTERYGGVAGGAAGEKASCSATCDRDATTEIVKITETVRVVCACAYTHKHTRTAHTTTQTQIRAHTRERTRARTHTHTHTHEQYSALGVRTHKPRDRSVVSHAAMCLVSPMQRYCRNSYEGLWVTMVGGMAVIK